jgi:hypothetical protein
MRFRRQILRFQNVLTDIHRLIDLKHNLAQFLYHPCYRASMLKLSQGSISGPGLQVVQSLLMRIVGLAMAQFGPP